MKKSTKIILIASGTVIFVSVVLVIVLALTIRAAENKPQTPPPSAGSDSTFNPLPSGKFNCESADQKDPSGTGVKIINGKYSNLKKISDDTYSVTIEWQYSGVNTFLTNKVYGDGNAKADHYNFKGNIDKVSKSTPFQGGTETTLIDQSMGTFSAALNRWNGQIKLTPGENKYIQIMTTLCWDNRETWPRNRYMDMQTALSSISRPADGSDPPSQGNLSDSTEYTGGAPATSTQDEVCAPCTSNVPIVGTVQKIVEPLEYIVCEIRCMAFKVAAAALNWAWNVMTYYAGLETSPPKFETFGDTSSETSSTSGTDTGTSGGSSGGTQQSQIQVQAKELCNQEKSKYTAEQWEKGPCLTPNLNNSGYAIDIAHKPRQTVDNQNTCPSSTKWVELNTSCEVIEQHD